jgi:hypothetical protein
MALKLPNAKGIEVVQCALQQHSPASGTTDTLTPVQLVESPKRLSTADSGNGSEMWSHCLWPFLAVEESHDLLLQTLDPQNLQ